MLLARLLRTVFPALLASTRGLTTSPCVTTVYITCIEVLV